MFGVVAQLGYVRESGGLMRTKRRLLTRTIRRILKSGKDHPEGLCSLPRPLYGSARVQLLFHLDRHRLVRITNWGSGKDHGLEIGTITSAGAKALRDDWCL